MSPTRPRPQILGIIPAAGLGRRMGVPKQALPYGDSTMVGTVVRTLLDAGLDGVVVVTRTELIDRLDLPSHPGVQTAVNDDAETEMIDSIRIGLSAIDVPAGAGYPAPAADAKQGKNGVLVVPGDMPDIGASAYRTCLAAYRADPLSIVVATHGGRSGHPMIFPLALRSTVDQLQGGLRTLLDVCSDRVQRLEVDDPGVARDIDTPEDYGRVRPG